MTERATSLRVRLLVLILVPLIFISIIAGNWRYSSAKATAEEIFDRNLLAITLAVSRDLAISGGEAFSPATQHLFEEASGGRVFYHLNGLDGAFLAGFAYPPRYDGAQPADTDIPLLFDSVLCCRRKRDLRRRGSQLAHAGHRHPAQGG